MRRTSTGKRIAITPRDVEIFKSLERYRYLRSTYIHAFVGGLSQTRFKERLGDLFHEGFIDRPSQQWAFANARHSPVIYELGAGARRVLQEVGSDLSDRCTFLADAGHRQFLHSLMICEVLASLDLAVRSTTGLRFIGWPEILRKAPGGTQCSEVPFRLPVPSGGTLVPDGLFGLEYTVDTARSYRFFALEADRGTMPVQRSRPGQTSYLGKIAAYRDIIARQVHKTHWGIPNLLVLTITTSEDRTQAMMNGLSNNNVGDNASFLFKAVATADLAKPANHLMFKSWDRPSLTALRIDR
jgi:hypothetical protein